MTQPLFSVIVPTRNRLETAKAAIASVLAQSHPDFELIVSDNSTGSGSALERWLRARADLPLRFTYVRTGGALEMDVNWETACMRASGRYLLVLPDRWVMRGGVLRLLAALVAKHEPQCVFWDSKLSIDNSGQFRSLVPTDGPLHCDFVPSTLALENLLKFRGYLDRTVYTQPFPRGLNSIIRTDVIDTVRRKTGAFFAPNTCDYTSGVSALVNTNQLIYVRDSLYLAIGNDSNGERLSIYGVPEKLKPSTQWHGLQVDAIFLTVLNDIEQTLKRNGASQWLDAFDKGNAMLSLLAEIHTKEWHGSPLDTATMRLTLFRYAEKHLGPRILSELQQYDQRNAPKLRTERKLLQSAGLFYPLYRLKHALKEQLKESSSQFYSDDLLSHRSLVVGKAQQLQEL